MNENTKKIYQEKYFQKIKNLIMLLGCAYCGFSSYSQSNIVLRFALILIFLVGFYKSFKLDYYLPFLGDCVLPSGLFSTVYSPLGADTNVVIANLPPKCKVIYWASETNENTDIMPWEAYGDYQNAGVAVASNKGEALCSVRSPSGYMKPNKMKLKPHIHYRYTLTKGMLSKVYTKYL